MEKQIMIIGCAHHGRTAALVAELLSLEHQIVVLIDSQEHAEQRTESAVNEYEIGSLEALIQHQIQQSDISLDETYRMMRYFEPETLIRDPCTMTPRNTRLNYRQPYRRIPQNRIRHHL